MEKKSIGRFIAILRKSKGMTQREVADRLNVSNKTISKWERDDGYPEITMIPAIAELFDVTSDEILRGERIVSEGLSLEKTAKVEKQILFLLNQAAVRFKNMSFVAMALIFAGLNVMFTISYAAYRPIIGFGVMLALVAAGMITELIGINVMYSAHRGNELTAEKEENYLSGMLLLYRYSYTAFSLAIFTIVLSLPLVVTRDQFIVKSVLQFGEYLKMLPWLLLAATALCFLGNLIARRSLKTILPRPTISLEQQRRISKLNKKIILIFVVLIIITVGAQMAVNILATASIGHQFDSRKEMEKFSEQARQYENSKAMAIHNGYIIMKEDQINPGTDAVFHVQPQFESIYMFSWDELKVYYWQDFSRLAVKKRAIASAFATVFFLEITLVAIIYLRKKAKIQ